MVIKKTITYKDLNQEETTETFEFHLNKAEWLELELSHDGGLSESMKRIIAAEDNETAYMEFKKIILSAYGKRTEDGKRFLPKTQEQRDEFGSSEAFSELIWGFFTNVDTAVEFINNLMPEGMVEDVEKLAAGQTVTEEKPIETPPRTVTPEELKQMGISVKE